MHKVGICKIKALNNGSLRLIAIQLMLPLALFAQGQTKSSTPSVSMPSQAASANKGDAPEQTTNGYQVTDSDPLYPAIAKKARIQGKVVLHATISKQGTPENLGVVSGPPMLQQAAINKVRSGPQHIRGNTSGGVTQIVVEFVLSQLASSKTPTNAPNTH